MAERASQLRLRLPQVPIRPLAPLCDGSGRLTTPLRFVVIASTRDMARRVFNSPTYVKPCVVDVAHKLLGHDNWVFLDGKAHLDYRKGLNGLFTRKALQSYLPGQEEVYKSYFERFVQVTKVRPTGVIPRAPSTIPGGCARRLFK